MYYIFIKNGVISGSGEAKCLNEDIINLEVSKELYDDFVNDNLKYIFSNGEIIANPDYEKEKIAKHRQELDQLTLTPADVERALYKAKGMDFDDLKHFISLNVPTIDVKALSIEFRAKDFFRGAKLSDGTRLIDMVGAMLGYTSDDMDYLFINKELPVNE
ncbi:hypothetical protein IJ182_01245 [bacterium]|nr:hypothetical protein [bacterium]